MYNFENNLLKLSLNQDINYALLEWDYIYNDICNEKSGLCICQHKIKNIYFMYNKLTNNMINVGSNCYKKFGFKKNKKINNPIFYNVIKNIFQKGEYEIINDLNNYVNKVEELFIKYITNEYNIIINKYPIKLDKLEELLNNIDNLINEYNIQYLTSIFNEIKEKINKLKKETLEKLEKERLEKLEKERLERERLERERLEKERLERERLEKERLEKERLEKERLERDKLNNKPINIPSEVICISCHIVVSTYNTWNREKKGYYCNSCQGYLY